MAKQNKESVKAEPVEEKVENIRETVSGTIDSDPTLIRILTHIGAIVFFVFPPLIVYFVTNNKEVKETAKEVLNFEISIAICVGIAGILTSTIIFAIIGLPMLGLAAAAQVFFPIFAAIKVSKGGFFKYPFTIRLIK